MDATAVGLALLTGLLTGGVFKYLDVPIPAPPNLAGIMGIIGIFLGYKLVEVLLAAGG
jgi:XapX domain-containing protein